MAAIDINVVQVLAGAVAISFSSVFVKLAHIGPTAAGFYRVFFGGLVLLGLVVARRERLWQGRRPFLLAAAAGLAFALDLTFWHVSIHFIGPGLATILANFQVFFLAAIGVIFMGERLSPRLGLAIPLSLAGLLLLVGPDWSNLGERYQLGVLCGLATAVCYTAYLLTLRRTRGVARPLSSLANMAVISLTCAAFLAVEVPLLGESFAIVDGQTWASLLGLGVAAQVLGWVWISQGLPKMDASRGGLVLFLQPTLAFLWDIVIFSRPTGMIDAAGATLALGAIYLGLTSRTS